MFEAPSRRPPPPQRRVIVTDLQIEEALAVLASDDAAHARGSSMRAEALIKHERAIAAGLSDATSAAAKDREAEASPRYAAAVDRMAAAVIAYEMARARREWANMAIEVWRSQNATRRMASP